MLIQMEKELDLNMPVIENISPLHFDHKLGFFGDYENKDDILKLSEVKELSIFQIAKFKKSSVDINEISFNNLKLPTKSLTVISDNIARILWVGPDTWLIVSRDKNLNKDIHNIFNDNDFYPYIDHIFKSFGPERILFGSDWPVCLLAANYKKVTEIVKNYLKSHSKKTRLNVMGLNAIKIYNL